MATLDRAFSVAADQDATHGVGHDLHLNVTGTFKQALDVERPIGERRLRFALCDLEGTGKLLGCLDPTHSATATTGGGLQQHRIPRRRRSFNRQLHRADGPFRTTQHRETSLDRRALRGDLVTHALHDIRRRANEGQVVISAGTREVRIL